MKLWPFQYQGFVEPPPAEANNPAIVCWQPEYPDRIPPKPGLTAAILAGACFFVVGAVVPVAATTPSGPGGSAQVFPGTQVQYQASAAPITETIPVVHVPTIADWLPRYPDWIPIRPHLVDDLQQAFAFHPVPIVFATSPGGNGTGAQIFPGQQVQYQASAKPFDVAITTRVLGPADWGPIYPSRIAPRILLGAEFQQAFGFDAQPFTTPPIGWLPTYPDRIVPKPGQPALQQTLAFHPTPEHTIARAWAPIYPDTIDRRTYPTSAQLAYVSGSSVIPVTDLRWKAVYPDWLARVVYPTSQQLAYMPGLSSSTIPIRDLRWQGTYPSSIDRLVYLTANQLAFTTGLTSSVIPVTDLRWQAHYPDRLDPPPRPFVQSFVFDPFPRVVTTTIEWLPRYPDRLDALPRRLPDGTVLPPFVPITDLRWLGRYPSRLDPAPQPQIQSFTFDPFPRVAVVTTLEWLPTYPDPTRLQPVQPPFGTVLPPYVPITDLRWQGRYPDRLDPARSLLVAAQQAVAFHPTPEQTIALAWQPVYPSTIDRRLYPVSQQLAFVANLVPEVTIARAWTPVYPDAIDRRVYPTSQQLAHVLLTPSPFPVPALSWLGTYPDRLYPTAGLRADLQRTFVFDPFPLPTLIVPLSWLAQYPDVIDRLTYLTANQVAWVSVASTLIWSGPVVIPCPDTGAGDPLVIIGRGW